MKSLIEAIDEQRRLRKISKRDICTKTGISAATYWRYLTNKADINLSTLQKLADSVEMRISLSNK